MEIFKRNSFIFKIYNKYSNTIWRFFYKINPKIPISFTYRIRIKKRINWKNPQNLIEKIAWMELNTDTSLWSLCADKYRVREYVEKCGCGQYLNELLGVWKNPNDINFEALPSEFVLKANNGCGTVLIVKDKTQLNIPKTKKILQNWIRHPYGYRNSQRHYLNIDRCIIAEKLIENDSVSNRISPGSLIDYKVWCINGKVESVLVVFNRHDNLHQVKLFDPNWNELPQFVRAKAKPETDVEIPKPDCLAELLDACRELSVPFPEVRADFYIINNRPIFGELTFSAGFGSLTEEYFDILGEKTRMPIKTMHTN